MKILVIGDFHGKFPQKLKNKIKKEEFDLIVSPGDFCGSEELSKLFFKHVYGTENDLADFIGEKKEEKLEKQSFDVGIKVLKQLNKLGKVLTVTGNWDPTSWGDVGFPIRKGKFNSKFKKEVKKLKNIKIIDFKSYKFKGINFVGYPRSSYPGRVTKHITKKYKKRFGSEAREVFKQIKSDNKLYFNELKKSFGKNKDVIFISHNCPYRTKLDKIKKGPQKGKHYGSYLAKKIIKELKPRLVICGHIHETKGKQQIGRTTVVNAGAAYQNKAAIIEFNEKKKKVEKIKFLR